MDTDAEFWRKRAKYYGDICLDLIAEMGRGVKLDSIIINENGITFTKRPGCKEVRSDENTISRRAAIDEITEYGSGDTIYMSVGELKRRIEHLPPAQQEPKWIPCSERLPEKSGQYYVSGGDKVWICEFLIIQNFIGGWCNDVANPVVQAWMPLPEPWKGGQP